eukprot:scaffold1954_cov268-Pinguiococcus_pyrenoidosus.AAC.23
MHADTPVSLRPAAPTLRSSAATGCDSAAALMLNTEQTLSSPPHATTGISRANLLKGGGHDPRGSQRNGANFVLRRPIPNQKLAILAARGSETLVSGGSWERQRARVSPGAHDTLTVSRPVTRVDLERTPAYARPGPRLACGSCLPFRSGP